MKATKEEAFKTNIVRTFFGEDRYPLFRKGKYVGYQYVNTLVINR